MTHNDGTGFMEDHAQVFTRLSKSGHHIKAGAPERHFGHESELNTIPKQADYSLHQQKKMRSEPRDINLNGIANK